MNVYVFEGIEQLTDNYHCEGGLVIVAKNRSHAEELIEWANDYDEWEDYGLQSADISISDEEWANVTVYPTSDDAEPSIYVFPDAGCC